MKKNLFIILTIQSLFTFAQIPLKIVKVIESDCDKSVDIDRVQHRIVHQTFKADTLNLTIGVVCNCAGIYKVKAQQIRDTIFFNYEEGSVDFDTIKNNGIIEIVEQVRTTTCDCCFEFQFTVSKVPQKPKIIFVNGQELTYHADKYRIFPIKFDVVGSDTLNYSDRYGLKQGRWTKIENDRFYEIDSLTKYDFEAFYINNRPQTAIFTAYDSTGKVISREQRVDFNNFNIEDYYPNGTLKMRKSRHIKQLFYPDGVLQYESRHDEKSLTYVETYYYQNGTVMSIFTKKQSLKNRNKVKWKRKYYNSRGKRVSRRYLIKRGYQSILDLW